MRYALGIDFGTLSARALLVDVETGTEVATSVCDYPSGVIDDILPTSGAKLPPDWALQDPRDYLTCLGSIVRSVMADADAKPQNIVGIGLDFTACTILPIDKNGDPLCLDPKWRNNPHAWVKLWKHHAAQPEANKITETALARGETFLNRYGGKVSSEWFFPKVLQILDESPEVYYAAGKFIEAGDWIAMKLTGAEARSACAAGYKSMWDKQEGFPSNDFLRALDPRLEHVIDEKMSRNILPVGAKAGELTTQMAEALGLAPGTAVAVCVIDAHAAIPAATVTKDGTMVIIMGTSSCHIILGKQHRNVEGISGYVEDGVIPSYYGFEAGQCCVGDHFAWLVDTSVPASYTNEAKSRGIGIHDLLMKKAAKLKPGESGLLALDWWNGNRSVLVDADLTGMIVGMKLDTKPEDIYRALIEATAFGTKVIIDAFERDGIAVDEIVACGGLPEKNPLLMQIYADVTNREFKVAASAQTCALGSAMWGAVAAGRAKGGYDNITQAAEKMASVKDISYKPDAESNRVYSRLFAEYMKLHDYFGRGGNNVMKVLKDIKSS